MYYRSGGRNEKDRYAYSYLTAMRFLEIKCGEKSTKDFFEMHKFTQIAIYGASGFGKLLFQDIKSSNIKVNCFIDPEHNNFPKGYMGIPVVGIQEKETYYNADVIVVTSIYEYNQIIDELLKLQIPLEKIISINDIVYGME